MAYDGWGSPPEKKPLSLGEKIVVWMVGIIFCFPFIGLIFSYWIQFLLENFLPMNKKEADAMAPILGLIAAVFTPVACALIWKWFDYKKVKLQLDHERRMKQDERNYDAYQQTIKIPGGS